MTHHRFRRRVAPLLLLGLLGCDPADPAPVADASATEPQALVAAWQSTPTDGVGLWTAGDTLLVETGPHVVLWPSAARRLEPPYTVRATLHKQSGRIHEGYGLVFGGDRLDAPEHQQAYSYFLIRGDGSFLIRRREGTALPILRGWTSDPAILRDRDESGQPNELEVVVRPQTTSFRVNGSEVATLPTSELRVRGVVGLRVAHDVTLRVEGFLVDPRAAGEAIR